MSRQLLQAEDPRTLSQWNALARDRTFYVSADWLAYADRSGVSRSRYWLLDGEHGPMAALSTHWVPEEPSAEYRAASVVDMPAGPDATVLTLGGRRGYRSALLAGDKADDDAVALLLGAAVEAVPATRGLWWWPYLAAGDARRVLRAAAALPGSEPSVHLVGADCTVDIAGTDIEAHIERLTTTQRRTNFRRERRRFADSGLQMRELRLADHWPVLGPLLANVQQKYGHDDTPEQMQRALRGQAEALGDKAVVFACDDGDGPVAFSMCYRWGDELALRVVGFDYARLRNADEYAMVAVHAPLDYCYRHGLRRLHLGLDSYEAKLRRGGVLGPLWAVTSWRAAADAAERAAEDRLAGQFPAQEADEFRRRVHELKQQIALTSL